MEGPLESVRALHAIRLLPIDTMRYGDTTTRFADEFHEALGLPKQEIVTTTELLGALLGAMKAIDDKVSRIEDRLAIAGANHG